MNEKSKGLVVTAPQIGVNEYKLTLVEWLVSDHAPVAAGDAICVLETMKAAFEVQAEISGTLVHLVPEGAEVMVSRPIALIATDPEWLAAEKKRLLSTVRTFAPSDDITAETVPAFRATHKAVRLARELGLDLSTLGSQAVIREQDVRRAHVAAAASNSLILLRRTDRIPVVIYGAGQGGMTVKECLDAGTNYEPVGFVSDHPGQVGQSVMGLTVYSAARLDEWMAAGVTHFFPAVADGLLRVRLIREWSQHGLEPVNAIHPTAFIAPSVGMGRANFIKAGAVLETETRLGNGCIVDNRAVAAHHCLIRDGCHLAPGVSLGGGVTLEQYSIIGVGAAVASDITVGAGAVITPGSAVLKDVPAGTVIEGVPGRIIGKRK